ncbi:acetyl-CoA C-acyltransferase family protein [Pseudomonas aeruginosa]|uniref:acetyl-CoA C-acyltransferase family protein n=1 Tax=Pseudomonas aeruginosa TaxID=287 RepID=UPI00106D3541|nr:acetyl-CoA C-acyltransferase family protein [Pseudomonas aeruginosa]EKW5415306.1 acetyl-CoA C-acyltransferase family protein [Pseudomonas aeruginosa]MCL8030824.1 acetyl-CoA C-acyltransferase family protein [Pseudomonas aeruginosa]
MSTPDIFFVSATRTAIGTFGGTLKDIPVTDLASLVVKQALLRADIEPARIGHVVMGNVIPTSPQDIYLSRVAALNASIPQETPAFNVNRLCGSGLQAIVSAAQVLRLGEAEVVVAGGAESMSRGPYTLAGARWGNRMGNVQAEDFMLAVLHDPLQGMHMGVTAENIAERFGISRAEQDELALQSQQRASRAIAKGYFTEQISAVPVKTRQGMVDFDRDEHVRSDVDLDQLQRMKPVFKKDGSVTAGNASGLNDGASALVMATADAVRAQGLKPMARLVSHGHSGVAPELMGLGPIPATRQALERAGLKAADLDVIECNEAFAAQACAVVRELELDPQRVNPNGSGISLGHPVGATGAILTTKAIYELQRTHGRYALITLCIGGGQGIAMIIERT